MIVFIDLLNP